MTARETTAPSAPHRLPAGHRPREDRSSQTSSSCSFRAELCYRERRVRGVCRDRQRELLRCGEIVREDVALDRVVAALPRTDIERVRPYTPSGLQILAVNLDAEPIVVLVDVHFTRIAPVHRANSAHGSGPCHLFLLWLLRQIFSRQQPETHGNYEFDAYVVRRYLADVLHGETNRPTQSRHGLVLGELIVVVRVVRPE